MQKNKSILNKIKSINWNFSNTLIVLTLFALISMVIYGVLTTLNSSNSSVDIVNQLNQNNSSNQDNKVENGDGYNVVKRGGQYYLEIIDASKVKDINLLLNKLGLPSNTEVWNSALGHPRPVDTSESGEIDLHDDSQFTPITENTEEMLKESTVLK